MKMYKQKIGISLSNRMSVPAIDMLETVARVGFDAVSPAWDAKVDVDAIINKAKKCGLTVQSLHASFGQVNRLWSADEKAYAYQQNEILAAIDTCVKHAIPILVCHVWIGWGNEIDLADACYTAFDNLVSAATKKGIKLAFENTEGEQYLEALMERYKNSDTVGFCWDSGHEQCYAPGADLLQKYGDRLLITHLNDNLGCQSFEGNTTSNDDLHLLPYDGIADWDYNVRRLKKAKPLEILNFELLNVSKHGRHENDVYTKMSLEEYFTTAYMRACKIAYNYSK